MLTGLAFHLVLHQLLDEATALRITADADRNGVSFIQYLAKTNIIDGAILLQNLAKIFNLPVINLDEIKFQMNQNYLSRELMQRYRVIALEKEHDTLRIALSDPTNHAALDALRFHTGFKLSLVLVTETQLNDFLEAYCNPRHLETALLDQIDSGEEKQFAQENYDADEPLIRFVDQLIQHAIQQSASDIHIEPYEHYCRIRYRRDGLLYEIAEIQSHLSLRLTTRLKVLAKINISERRLPQDGRFQFSYAAKKIMDIRVSICPTLFGEKIVLRLLDSTQLAIAIDQLGLNDAQKQIFLHKISQPQGLILVTGPTGSGKTVTLYSALQYLNTVNKNILTVEDPVEFQITGLNQVNVNAKIGLDFAETLRAFLRQDPDIIMVGEIRDRQTADIALQAAQTGHLVFSTLHTNSAAEAITRLQSMGIAPYQLSHTVALIIAQRLVRKLCEKCKQPEIISNTMKEQFELDTQTFYQAIGCEHCLYGYQGRTGIYELLSLPHSASEKNFTLKQAGIEKLRQGITSATELNRVI